MSATQKCNELLIRGINIPFQFALYAVFQTKKKQKRYNVYTKGIE